MPLSPFVLPDGVEIEISGEDLTLRYDGDIVLSSSIKPYRMSVHAGGDLVISCDTRLGTLSAGRQVFLSGRLEAERVHGRYVVIDTGSVSCRAISATHSIRVGKAKLAVDAVVAPQIEIASDASGRVTVIESHNERGTSKIKGGFSLEEYEELFGSAETFLADRGLESLGTPPPPSELEIPPIQRDDTVPPPMVTESASDPDQEDVLTDAAVAETLPEEEPIAEEITPLFSEESANEEFIYGTDQADLLASMADDLGPIGDDEEIDDPLSIAMEDLEPVELEPDPPTEEDHLHPRLIDAVNRISSCYQGAEMPPALSELRDLVDERDYARLRGNITDVWNGLLNFHQQRGIRPHHQVTHAFNVIHGLVQEL